MTIVLQPQDPIIGQVVNNLRVAARLGAGGMGAVYRLEHVSLPNTFKVMKVMLQAQASSEVELRFQQEAAVAAQVGTDRVVRVDDYGKLPNGTPYIIMEYVDGGDLADYLNQNGPLSVDKTLKLLFRISDTLAAAHAKGIVHRDMKPANILLEKATLRPKIGDWGIARASGEIKLAHTQNNVIVGTPGYMSPEAALGRPTDGRTDIYSLGVIAFQLLTGQLPHPPFEPMSATELAEFLLRPSPTIASMRPSGLEPVPEVVERIINRTIAKDVKNRYTRMVEVRDDVAKMMNDLASGGVVRAPMMTMLSAHADSSGPLETLRTTAGEVDALIERIKTPTPATHQPAMPAASTPPPPVTQPTPFPNHRTNAGIVALLAVLLAGAIGVGAWLLASSRFAPRKPPLTAEATDSTTPTPRTAVVGRVLLSTNPVGATVAVDGLSFGNAPVLITGKPGEMRRIHLSMAGYEDKDDSIVIANEDRKVEFPLSPSPARDSREKTRSVHKSAPREQSSQPSIEKAVNPWQ